MDNFLSWKDVVDKCNELEFLNKLNEMKNFLYDVRPGSRSFQTIYVGLRIKKIQKTTSEKEESMINLLEETFVKG